MLTSTETQILLSILKLDGKMPQGILCARNLQRMRRLGQREYGECEGEIELVANVDQKAYFTVCAKHAKAYYYSAERDFRPYDPEIMEKFNYYDIVRGYRERD